MNDFFQVILRYDFLRNALLAGLLSGISCGIIGTYVVTRRITYLAGGIAHAVLGGIGFARYMQVVHGWTFFTPMLGALAAAFLAALLIGTASVKAEERIDAVISALWGLGMAAGILFIAKTPGYGEYLTTYLFGSILLVTQKELLLIVGLDLLITVAALLFHKQFVAVCFDEEFARLQGLNTRLFFFLILMLTAVTVVLMVSIVGILMAIILLTLPAAIAGRFCFRMGSMMVLAAFLCGLFTFSGLAVSYGTDLPSGAVIIVLAATSYLLSLFFKKT